LKNLFWSFLHQIGGQTINVLLAFILTIFITPTEFGTFTMIVIFTDFSYILCNLGFGQALIKKKDPSQIDLNTVFWINISMSFIFSLIIVLFANSISVYYKNPDLEKYIYFIPIGYIASSFGIVNQMMIIKKMDFKSLFKIYFFSRFISGGISIFLAFRGFGIWSLLVQHVLSSILNTLFSFYYHSWKPAFLFSIKTFKEFKNFSFTFFGNETLNYFMDNIDKAIIGKNLSISSLGLYSRAISFTMIPVNNFPKVIDKYLFPFLSSQVNNHKTISTLYVRLFKILTFIIVPTMILLGFLSNDFVTFFFNEKWHGLILLMQLLSVSGLIISFIEINNSFFLVLNKTDILFRTNLITRIIIITGIIIGIHWDVKGVAISLIISNLIRLFIVWGLIFNFLKIESKKLLFYFLNTGLISFSLVLIIFLLKKYDFNISNLWFFIFEICFFISMYLCIAYVSKNKVFFELKNLIFNKNNSLRI
jgi:teichuronic acid exporter